ncbi:MAG: hypothetical protein AAFV88_00100 [Planctomycetota bacterium]
MKTEDMACHTWALTGNPLSGTVTHRAYESLCNEIAMPYLTGRTEASDGEALLQLRQENMEKIAGLCETRTQRVNHRVYVCGGFREKSVCPEHLWMEDHSAGASYDTFIDQPVRVVPRVGVVGQPFQPACEATPFAADEIARVLVQGFTASQYESLP